ncbi:MAG: MBL fold metallo-hydrolase [Pseudoflavonifractor sp.]
MFEVCTIASGSSGNCLVMTDGVTHILVDAGISARRICKALRELGIDPADLAGILVTHEHSDHVSGLTTLLKQLPIPVYATRATGRQLCYRIPAMELYLHDFEPGDSFELGSMGVETFPTPHDAAGSTGYALRCGCRKAAVVTDLGEVTAAVLDGIQGADLLVCEANHDVETLCSGGYPYYLKQRILGDHGHLSNEAGGALARHAAEHGAKKILLAHLSQENNTPAMAYSAVHRALSAAGIGDDDVLLEVAPRADLGRRYEV